MWVHQGPRGQTGIEVILLKSINNGVSWQETDLDVSVASNSTNGVSGKAVAIHAGDLLVYEVYGMGSNVDGLQVSAGLVCQPIIAE